ncbi:SGNH/GDSL hydrolase family protein [Paenibacillus sp. KN14-4R]|uniref:SGNH/GDSL hydrolase family protein n=1 Tax=Paenibacillus sp. KN14-4R TaxID=3445773 RepID=UPI003FA124F0
MDSSTSNSNNRPQGEEGTLVRSRRDKHRNPKKKLAWGLIGFIILLVLSEVFVFRNLNFYVPEKKFISQLAELDHSFRAADHNAIDTVIFGDSQSIDGLRPEMLANAAGMKPEQLFNFSLSGGKAFEIYHTYLKYKDQMPNMRRAIVVVNEHQINNAEPKAEQQPMFRYYAGLQDRLRVMNKDNYGDLLVGYVLKSFDLRTIWAGIVDQALDPKKKLSFEISLHPGGIAPNTVKGDLSAELAKNNVDRWMQNYDTKGILTDSFESLIRDLRAQGVTVTILRIPRTDRFEQAMQSGYALQQQQFHDTIRTIANRYGAEFEIISNEALQTEQDFRDVNHLNTKGAEWLCQLVASKWLK